jgi:hypothetical protein
MGPLSRREFFRASAFAGLAAFVAACAKKVPGSSGGKTIASIIGSRQQKLNLIVSDTETLSGRPDRLVFVLVDPDNGSLITVPSTTVWLARDQRSAVTGPLTAFFHDDGLGPKGVYETPINMPADGTWLALVEVTREGASTADVAVNQFQVGRTTAMPIPGDRAVAVPTPTTKNHLGVNPICTRKPPCTMHAISLDKALKNGKPTVLIIATPAFCQSRLCGPVTDVVQAVSKEFAGRANFIHVEVYRDDKAATIQSQTLSPAAASWKLSQEPAIYYIGPDGIIKNRMLGPADVSDVMTATAALVSTK